MHSPGRSRRLPAALTRPISGPPQIPRSTAPGPCATRGGRVPTRRCAAVVWYFARAYVRRRPSGQRHGPRRPSPRIRGRAPRPARGPARALGTATRAASGGHSPHPRRPRTRRRSRYHLRRRQPRRPARGRRPGCDPGAALRRRGRVAARPPRQGLQRGLPGPRRRRAAPGRPPVLRRPQGQGGTLARPRDVRAVRRGRRRRARLRVFFIHVRKDSLVLGRRGQGPPRGRVRGHRCHARPGAVAGGARRVLPQAPRRRHACVARETGRARRARRTASASGARPRRRHRPARPVGAAPLARREAARGREQLPRRRARPRERGAPRICQSRRGARQRRPASEWLAARPHRPRPRQPADPRRAGGVRRDAHPATRVAAAGRAGMVRGQPRQHARAGPEKGRRGARSRTTCPASRWSARPGRKARSSPPLGTPPGSRRSAPRKNSSESPAQRAWRASQRSTSLRSAPAV